MKATGLLALLAAINGALAVPQMDLANIMNAQGEFHYASDPPARFRFDQTLETDYESAAANGWGKVAHPAGAAPQRRDETSTFPVPGAKKIVMRHGPYKVPGMSKKSTSGHAGMLESYIDKQIEKPCSNCNILRQVGGLEYADAKNANIDTGMW
jgi:hypothetical protein